MIDPKLVMFQTVAKMLGVSPEMLMKAVETVATAGERLERVEAKIDWLINAAGADFSRTDRIPLAGAQPGGGADRLNGADHGI